MPAVAFVRPPARFLVGGQVYTGEFTEEQESTLANSRESIPDKNWSHVDTGGHFHAFDTKSGELPTLLQRSEHVPCDGTCSTDGCGGYPRARWFCVICGEEVTPQYSQADRLVVVSTIQWWEATIQGPLIMPSATNKFSVVIEHDGEPTRFGIAAVRDMTMESSQHSTMELIGFGALGWRPLETKGNAG